MTTKKQLIALVSKLGTCEAIKATVCSIVTDIVRSEQGFHQINDLYIEFTDDNGRARTLQVSSIVINVCNELLLLGVDDNNGDKFNVLHNQIDFDALICLANYIVGQLIDLPQYSSNSVEDSETSIVAKLVKFELTTRVVVNKDSTDEDIVMAAREGVIAKVANNELYENLVSIEDDTECKISSIENWIYEVIKEHAPIARLEFYSNNTFQCQYGATLKVLRDRAVMDGKNYSFSEQVGFCLFRYEDHNKK